MTTATQTQIRRDTATNLNAATPAAGEPGWDTTNNQLRVGDGTTAGGIRIPNAMNVQNQTFASVDAGGTADALTITLSPVPAAYAAYQRFTFKAASDNATTTPTLNANGLGAKTIKKKTAAGKSALAAGDIKTGCVYSVVYDGTDMQIETVPQGAGGAVETQTFTSNGTWTKPAAGTWAIVKAWGGGGSGGKYSFGAAACGGGGGGYNEGMFLLSDLSATETVTIGAGGAAQTTAATAGITGGNTSFGTKLAAYGGVGGATNGTGGGGGGTTSAGQYGSGGGLGGGTTGAAGNPPTAGGDASFAGGGGGGGYDQVSGNGGDGGDSYYGGGGGGGGTADGANAAAGGDSHYGGGGGGGGGEATSAGAGGTSKLGGAGGAGAFDANNATAGTAPGGGGGGAETGNSGAGGAGKCVVIVI